MLATRQIILLVIITILIAIRLRIYVQKAYDVKMSYVRKKPNSTITILLIIFSIILIIDIFSILKRKKALITNDYIGDVVLYLPLIFILIILSIFLMIGVVAHFRNIINNLYLTLKKYKMNIFSRKIKCEKFFTFRTNTINISGLSAGLSGKQVSGLNLKLGEVKIDPKFVVASELLQQLDLLQYTTCQNISGISSVEKRDELLEKLVDIKMKMLLIAQNPENAKNIVPSIPVVDNKTTESTSNNHEQNSHSTIRQDQLNTKIENQYKLLSEWEEKRDLSQNPTEKTSCEKEIERIKKTIKDYENEYRNI